LNTRQTHDPYQALRFRDFRLLLSGSFVNTLGTQMLGLAIGWELYDRTNSPLVLGLVGLVQVLPVFTLALVSGHVADQYDRKTVVILAQSLLAVATLGLTALSYFHGSLVPIFGCLLLIGIAGSFSGPAARTLPTEVVPESVLENSATWTSSSQQLASVIGPALGGVVIAVFHATTFVYVLSTLTALTLVVLLFFVKGGQATAATLARRKRNVTARTLVEGIVFLRKS
jgi:MFS family permease